MTVSLLCSSTVVDDQAMLQPYHSSQLNTTIRFEQEWLSPILYTCFVEFLSNSLLNRSSILQGKNDHQQVNRSRIRKGTPYIASQTRRPMIRRY